MMREPKLFVPWPVLLLAASVAAWERLVAGEASALAVWIVALWAACSLVARLVRRPRPVELPKFCLGSTPLAHLFAAAFRRLERL